MDLRTLKAWRAAGVVEASFHEDGELASVKFTPLAPQEPERAEETPAKPAKPKRTAGDIMREMDRKPWAPSGTPEVA